MLITGPGTVEAAVDGSVFRGGIDVQNGYLLLTGTGFVPVEVHGGEADLEGSIGDIEVAEGATLSVLDILRTAQLQTLNLLLETGGYARPRDSGNRCRREC